MGASPSEACAYLAKELKDPYYQGDEVGWTQTLGWVGAWTSRPSVYAVAAKSAADVAAAVNFARTHNLRDFMPRGRSLILSGVVGAHRRQSAPAGFVRPCGTLK